MAACQCSDPIRKHLLMEQALPFPLPCVCGCDDFILPRSDSNGGVDDSNRDNDEGDNEVFVPVGGGPLGVVVAHCTEPSAGFHFLW